MTVHRPNLLSRRPWKALLIRSLVILGLISGLLLGELELGEMRLGELGLGGRTAWAIDLAPVPTTSVSASGAAIFETNCAGCHAGGGNIIRRGKSLKLKALEKNQRASVALIADIVTHGKANMSAYGDRLTPSEITLISTYVWDQAQSGWKATTK